MKIAFCIRGHLRNGLNDNRLNDYINLLKRSGHSVDLFLHTWDASEAKSSYRTLDHSKSFVVKKSILKDYFKEHTIKHIIIANDSKLKLIGNLEGAMTPSSCPLIAWKRMWAGKFQLIQHLKDNYSDDYDLVVNTRYDMFTHDVCYTPVKNLLKMTTVGDGLSLKYPQYYRHLKGVDNYYCGSLKTIYDITSAFHYSLDEILEHYSIRSFHEELFYKYAVDHDLTR
jgi:hypothetical protein